LKGHPEGRETFLAFETQSRTLRARSGSHFTTLRIRVLFWNGQTNKCALNVHIRSGEFTELQLQGAWCHHLTLRYVHRYLSSGFHVVTLYDGIYAVQVPKNYPIFTCSASSHMRLILPLLKKTTKKGKKAVKKLNSFINTLTDQENQTMPVSMVQRPPPLSINVLNLGLNLLPDLTEHFYEYQHYGKYTLSSPDIAPMKACERKLMRHKMFVRLSKLLICLFSFKS
jgi:hypothetical protein